MSTSQTQDMSEYMMLPTSVYDCVHVQLTAQCQLRPDAEALATTSTTWTSQELEDRANELSCYLRSAGITRRQRVGICFRKSAWAIVSMLAVLKAGASCVPLDPDHPKARIETIVDAASISTVLVDQPHELFASFTEVRQIAVNDSDFGRMINSIESEAHAPETPYDSDDSAFVLFTSGSTGVPKAVLLSHSALCSSAKYHGEPMGVGPGTRVYQNAAYTFDMSIYDIFTTLMRGGTVCIPAPDTQMHNIADAVNELRCNWAFFTPTLLSTLLPSEVPGLTTILLAGEAVSQELVNVWASKTRLLNGYGSTEMSTCFLTQLTEKSDPRDIGVPQGVVTRIVSLEDPSQDSPSGRGQLVVCGPVLASGYLKQPPQSGFIRDPTFPQHVSYRTGDVVERTDTGSYLFHGRCDTMVKIRGYRVEMGEVESQLMGHALVEQAIVLYPRKGKNSEKLTAVVKLRDSVSEAWTEGEDGAVSSPQKALADYLRSKLPKYMIPQSWLVSGSMQTTSSGKIDRRAITCAVEHGTLQDLSRPQSSYQNSPPPKHFPLPQIPANALAKQITPPDSLDGSVSEASDDTPGVTEASFLDLGLDSINLIGLSKILKKAYDVDFDVATLGPLSMATLLPCIRAKLNVSNLADASSLPTRPRLSELFRHAYDQLLKSEAKSKLPTSSSASRSSDTPPLNVLLTGATGYVGTRILHHLLTILPPQSKIITLVRAPSISEGHQRLLDTLTNADIILSPKDAARLEVWLGDLTKPDLGLELPQLNRLRGGDNAVDVVIHNGAYVNWTSAYKTVSPANVHSTISLLRGLRESPLSSKIVYVSGGRALEVATNDGMRVPCVTATHDFNAANKGWDTIDDSGIALVGYDITKLVSDALVQSSGLNAHVVRPGYIIGDAKTGHVIARDYIWRVVATALTLGAHCEEPDTSFLYLAGVDEVSEHIVRPVRKMCEGTSDVVDIPDRAVQVNITSGVTIHDFWATVADVFDTELVSQGAELWIAAVDKNMAEQRPLYPVMEAHRADGGLLGVERPAACGRGSDAGALLCLEKSLRYLQNESDVFRSWVKL